MIDRAPPVVFQFYAVDHVKNHPRWDPDMHLEQETPGPIGVGTVIRRRHTHYGKESQGSMEVVRFEKDKVFGVVIHDGPIEIRGNMELRPEGEMRSRLTIGIEIPGSQDPPDPALIDRTLGNIKALIEAEFPESTG